MFRLSAVKKFSYATLSSIVTFSFVFGPLAPLAGQSNIPIAEAATAPALLKDINPTNYSSYPEGFINYDGYVWFNACVDDGDRCELYRTDGTEEGTELFPLFIEGDLIANPEPYDLVVAGDLLYFTAQNGDWEWMLWATDGDDAWIVADMDMDGTLIEFNGHAYFTSWAEDARHLWMTDGEEVINMTAGIEDIEGVHSITVAGDELFFLLEIEGLEDYSYTNDYAWQIWRVNDTEDGVELVEDFLYWGSEEVDYLLSPGPLTAVGDTVYFTTYEDQEGTEGFYLYKLVEGDGFAAGLIKQITSQECEWYYDWLGCDGRYPADFTAINGKLFFSADNGDEYYDVWISDGTTGGTDVFKVLEDNVYEVYVIGVDTESEPNLLWYITSDNEEGDIIRITDGDEVDISISLPDGYLDEWWDYNAGLFDGTLYVGWCSEESDDTDCELWRVNETKDGLELFMDLNENGYSYPENLRSVGGLLYFSVSDGIHGKEPWISDGTVGGTMMLKDIGLSGVGSDDEGTYVVKVGDKAFFPADDGVHGMELWMTDGTPEGTEMVADLKDNGDSIDYHQQMVAAGGFLYFVAEGEEGMGMYRTDGTDTTRITDQPFTLWQDLWMVPLGDTLYYWAYDQYGDEKYHVYKVTPDSPAAVQLPMAFNNFYQWYGNKPVVGNTLFFPAQSTEGEDTLYALHDDDIVVAHAPGGGVEYPYGSGIAVYYSIWGTDADGLYRITPDNEPQLVPVDGDLAGAEFAGDVEYLLTYDDSSNANIYAVHDGLLSEVPLWVFSNEYVTLYVAGDILYARVTGGDDRGLWATDGEGGMIQLVEAEDDDRVTNVTAIGNELFFSFRDDDYGAELWRSDGTLEGTDIFADIFPGTFFDNGDEYPRSSFPNSMTLIGTTMFFYAYTDDYGSEPWYIEEMDVSSTPPPTDDDEDNPPVSQPSRGSSSGGRTVAALAAAVPGANVVAIVAQLHSLIARFVAQGGELSPLMKTFLELYPNLPSGEARDLEYGMQGEDVRALQVLLIGQGYSIPAGATGLFLEQTQTALAAYQAAKAINPALGYFGPITRAFMKAAGLSGLWW